MSTPNNPPVSNLSANSKSLKNFQMQQKMKGLITVAVIGIPLIIGIVVYQFYLRVTKPSEALTTNQEITEIENSALPSETPTQEVPPSSTPNNSAATAPSGGTTSPQTNGTTPGSTTNPGTPVPAAMPNGVSIALNSIEQTGIKNNPYVAADTSSVPEGTTVNANRSSWMSSSSTTGIVSGTVTIMGSTKNGTISFQLISGTWKAVGYTIE